MTKKLFTILLPVHRHALFLPYAMKSVLDQVEQSFDLFIVCDGAPPDTVDYALQLSRQDKRIKVFVNTKGERNGELHRHHALQHANSKYVAGIADDDLWLSNHLLELHELLKEFDFGNLIQTRIEPGKHPLPIHDDLANPATIKRMLESKYNFFGPTVCGYRLSAYNKLKVGWSPAPDDIWSDLFMWRKFLRTEGLTFGTRCAISSLHFPASTRKDTPTEERLAEIKHWSERIQSESERQNFFQEATGTTKDDL